MKPVPYLFDNLFSWLQKKCPGRNWIDGSSSQIWIRNQNLEIFTDPEHWITGTHLMI
jgi:hypothetical protein